MRLAQTGDAEVNNRHLLDLLADHEEITVSRSSMRRILRGAGIASPRTHRPAKHRQRRERTVLACMHVQLDVCSHAWLKDRGPRLSLSEVLDDATNTLAAAVFRCQEDAHSYFQVLQHVVTTGGVSLAVYRDRYSLFRPVNQKETPAEHLAGEREPTQFGRLFRTLGVESIRAYSPQARGRVEGLFGTLQDRLVGELRLARIGTVEEAKQFLHHDLPRFNTQFTVPATSPASTYRSLNPALDLERTFAFAHQRTVAMDNTRAFTGQRWHLVADPHLTSYVRCRVTVHEHLDGYVGVTYQGRGTSAGAGQRAPSRHPADGSLPCTALPPTTHRPTVAPTAPAAAHFADVKITGL